MSAAGASSRRRRRHGFSRRDALHGWTLHFGPNMTPMVDVVMVMLVFFMASAAFVGSDWFLRAGVVEGGKGGASGPQAAAVVRDPLSQRLEVIMDADANGRALITAFELSKVPMEAFTARVAALPRGGATAKLEIIVKPVAQVAYQDVVRVHEACYAAGIEKVGLGGR